MAAIRRRTSLRAFTLVELMIVVAIVGVLASIAILGVKHYMAAAHSSEAKEAVGAIARGAALAYDREVVASQGLAEGAVSNQATNNLCLSAQAVPMAFASIQGQKYQPITSNGNDFFSGDSLHGWMCLNYAKSEPIAYQYTYTAYGVAGPGSAGYVGAALGGPNPGANGFEAAAQGDLDADNSRSTFACTGTISTTTREMRLATQVFTFNEAE